jgi:hydrogenase maturation factor
MCLGTIGRVTTLGADRRVLVQDGDREITASLLAMGEPVTTGDWVLVHSGLVLERLTEQEAGDALELREPKTGEST